MNGDTFRMRALVTDVETVPMDGVMDYYDAAEEADISAPANYKDEGKIAAYIEAQKLRKRAQHVEKAALDPDLCRIAVMGFWQEDSDEPTLIECRTEDVEVHALCAFWSCVDAGLRIVGYNALAFDLPVICRRSLYLGVPIFPIERSKYRHPRVDDLYDILTEQGRLPWRSVAFYAKRFGIPHDDPVSGKDVPALIADGRWKAVVDHCRCDLTVERAIAERIGVMSAVKNTEPVEVI
jgi:hypothetical protein